MSSCVDFCRLINQLVTICLEWSLFVWCASLTFDVSELCLIDFGSVLALVKVMIFQESVLIVGFRIRYGRLSGEEKEVEEEVVVKIC